MKIDGPQFVGKYKPRDTVAHILDGITIADNESWSAKVELYGSGVRFSLQCFLPDTTATLGWEWQVGRWWYLDQYECENEEHIVKQIWMAYEAFMKHEIMERFRYKGALVFDPHQSIFN